jgi:hypothetical protein
VEHEFGLVLQQEVDPQLPAGERAGAAVRDTVDDIALALPQIGRDQGAIDANGAGEIQQRHEIRVANLEQVACVEAIFEEPLDAAVVELADHLGTGSTGMRCSGRLCFGLGHRCFPHRLIGLYGGPPLPSTSGGRFGRLSGVRSQSSPLV